MTKLFLALALTFTAKATADAQPPLCEGNQKLATEAALKAAGNLVGGPCSAGSVKKNMDWPSEGIEGWSVQAQCKNKPLRNFSVQIRKSNNVCTIKFVKMSPLTGSQCGLTDTWGGDEDATKPQWKFIESQKITIQNLTPAQIRALPQITKEQIINTISDESASDVERAIKYLVDGSEGHEVYWERFSFGGKEFASVVYYPGGNAVGAVFLNGFVDPIAVNGDGEMTCVE